MAQGDGLEGVEDEVSRLDLPVVLEALGDDSQTGRFQIERPVAGGGDGDRPAEVDDTRAVVLGGFPLDGQLFDTGAVIKYLPAVGHLESVKLQRIFRLGLFHDDIV